MLLQPPPPPNNPPPRRIHNQTCNSADQQCLPRVALQRDVNHHDQRQIYVSQRLPNGAKGELKDDDEREYGGNLEMRHLLLLENLRLPILKLSNGVVQHAGNRGVGTEPNKRSNAIERLLLV